MDIIREDPPQLGVAHADIAAKLKADPGNWYRIAEGIAYPQLATSISRGSLAAYRPKGTYEATSRTAENGTHTVWARYLGDHAVA